MPRIQAPEIIGNHNALITILNNFFRKFILKVPTFIPLKFEVNTPCPKRLNALNA